MAVQAPRRLFTVSEFYQMGDAGIFHEDDRVELLAGEIVQMTPVGSRHAACVSRLIHVLTEKLGRAANIRAQDPVRLDDYSEPQPDIAIVKFRPDFYQDEHPRPGDVLLLIEVADTSAQTDRLEKIPLYGQAGIPEVWIVDVAARVVDVYRQPSPVGYREQQRRGPADRLAAIALPTLDLAVSDLLA